MEGEVKEIRIGGKLSKVETHREEEKERGRGCVARTQEPAEGLLFAQSGTQLQLPE